MSRPAAGPTSAGVEQHDPRRWLEEPDSPVTRAFVAAQERRTRAVLDAVPERDDWRALLERKARHDRTEPLGGGFFLRIEAGAERAVLVGPRGPGAPEPVVLLDPGAWGDAGASLAFAAPSPTGAHVAFGKAQSGGHDARIHVLEVATGRVLPGTPFGRDHSDVAWLPDGSGFFYSACPESGADSDYWSSVYLYSLDAPQDRGRRVFGDDRVKEYWCRAEVSACGRYAVFYKYDFVHACDVFLQRLGDEALVPVATGMRSLSQVQVMGDRLLVRTDLGAPRGRGCVAPLDAPADWRTILPEGDEVLQTVTGAGGRLYAVWSRGGHHAVTVHDPDSGALLREVALPSLGVVNHHDGSGVVSGVSEASGGGVRVRFESLLHPPATYRYDYDADRLTPEHVPDVVGFAASDYVTEQVHYPSADGTRVPLLLVRRRDATPDGERPVLLRGYGGFGIPMEPRWSPLAATWLETGGMVALAGIRGGGEYGKEWHDAARGRNRQRAFDDFVAAARWLASSGWTRPGRIVARGNSNGGLTVAVAAMQAPDAFGAVVSRAAVLDMLHFPRFGFLAAATVEYGSPDDPEDAAYLAGYSPYHNVRPDAAYPVTLFIAALDDHNAPPYDPIKMVARLRSEAPRGGPYLLLPLHASGHGGGTTTSALVEQDLDELCFYRWALLARKEEGRP